MIVSVALLWVLSGASSKEKSFWLQILKVSKFSRFRRSWCFLCDGFAHLEMAEWGFQKQLNVSCVSDVSLQISEIYVSGESSDLTAKEKLLLWSQQATEGYPSLRCVNFTSSWSDGRMFNALLHKYRSGGKWKSLKIVSVCSHDWIVKSAQPI